jgi:hypothetical protein
MKTYSGELKEGMLFKDINGEVDAFSSAYHYTAATEVYHDNEWQLYKPQPKKVWGIPEVGQSYYTLTGGSFGLFTYSFSVVGNKLVDPKCAVWLSKEHAEQHAKALNMANEFRLLSDEAVDNVKQWCVNSYGKSDFVFDVNMKLQEAIFGVVFNTKEQAEQALAKFPQIHIANKIIQFGFHGIVEERL